MKKCFVVCWFGSLPTYLPVWLKSCKYNPDYDFLLFTDARTDAVIPDNVKFIPFSMGEFVDRCRNRIDEKTVITTPYRICDFRPMYGVIFENELKDYDFWGYCDIDIVLGNINDFVGEDDLNNSDAVFNGGHFTLVRNCDLMNNLFKRPGALFDYRTVDSKEAIYAFDETTGFQSIAKTNEVKAIWGIPYVETESKYTQLRSRLEKSNPDNQCFYWENGKIFRVKEENGTRSFQELAYIHLQKRKLNMLDNEVAESSGIWISPNGFSSKDYEGWPLSGDIICKNPCSDTKERKREEHIYKMKRIVTILKRNPYQIYVRVKQQRAGINAGDASREEMTWRACSSMQ